MIRPFELPPVPANSDHHLALVPPVPPLSFIRRRTIVDRPDDTPFDRVLDGEDVSVRFLATPSASIDFCCREALGCAIAFAFRWTRTGTVA